MTGFGYNINGFGVSGSQPADPGQQVYSTPGTYSWICPEGVDEISVVAVGGGGGGYLLSYQGHGGGGGGLGWKNEVAVSSGESYTVVVGVAGIGSRPSQSITHTAGGDSYFNTVGTIAGLGGTHGNSTTSSASPYSGLTVHPGGSYVGDGGGQGGGGGAYSGPNGYNSGGGAGGYSGLGGCGGSRGWPPSYVEQHTDGQGGGGGGGGLVGGNTSGGGGGGVGLLGEGDSGEVGSHTSNATSGGGGGSGGADGGGGSGYSPHTAGAGGAYGGGGASTYGHNGVDFAGDGSGGAVRIMWGVVTPPRSFPDVAGDV